MDIVLQPGFRQKHKNKILYVCLSLLSIAGIVFLMQRNAHTYSVTRSNINTAIVSEEEFREYIAVTGTVLPVKSLSISTVEGGIVAEKMVEEGSFVPAGTALIRLHNAELQQQYMTQETQVLDQMNNLRNTKIRLEETRYTYQQQLLEAEYQLLLKEREHKMNTQLHSAGAINKAEYLKVSDEINYLKEKIKLLQIKLHADSVFQKSQEIQLNTSEHLMQKNLDLIRRYTEQLIIRAPVSGLITRLQAERGENKNKGENIGIIDLPEGYKIEASIDEHYIGRIKTGLSAEVEISGKKYSLNIIKVFPHVNNGQFKADLLFTGEIPEEIRNGLSLQLHLNLSESGKSLIIPKGGFYRNTGGQWIFVVQGNKAVKRNIRCGRQNPRQFEVLSGLKAGEEIVLSSYDHFTQAEELILE